MKYREFWIEKSSFGIRQCRDSFEQLEGWFDPIHVIEKKAYDELKQQADMLYEALRFYANYENWRDDLETLRKINIRHDADNNFVGGKRARETLKTYEDYLKEVECE